MDPTRIKERTRDVRLMKADSLYCWIYSTCWRRYETRNHLWLILEYCVGGDLMSLLKEDGKLPEDSIHGFARDLTAALQHLHAAGMAYNDLKPSNILLDEDGRVKLGGFGLSHKMSAAAKAGAQQASRASLLPPPWSNAQSLKKHAR